MVECAAEEQAHHEQNVPVDRENHECVARDVSQDSFDCSDGGDVWNLVGCDKGGYKACDAEERTGDEYREGFSEVVIHDAEIRVRDFECSVENERRDGCGDHKTPGNAFFPFPTECVANRFLAQPTAGEKE